MSFSRTTFSCMLLLAAQTTAAQDAQVRVDFDPADEIWVGQRVSFFVVLMTPDRFSGVPQFDIPPVAGAILLKNSGSAFSSSERIDGETWITQRHRFSVFAQRAGVIRIPEITTRFETRRGLDDPISHELPTEAFDFTAKMPAGAERLNALVSTSSLDVTETWNPSPRETQVGAAFTRTVTRTAPNVMAMAFPPLPQPDIDGIAVYAGNPEVGDRESRGQLTGRRVDRITYVIEEPGSYTLPAVVIPWFDLDAGDLKTEELPSVTLVASAKPQPAEAEGNVEVTAVAEPANLAGLVTGLLVLAAGSMIVWWKRHRFREWWCQCQTARAETEAAHFRRFRDACRDGDPLATLNALMSWLDRINPGPHPATIAEFVRNSAGSDVATRLNRLQVAAVNRDAEWNDGRLPEAVSAFWRRERRSSMPHQNRQIPRLNPGRSQPVSAFDDNGKSR